MPTTVSQTLQVSSKVHRLQRYSHITVQLWWSTEYRYTLV